MAEQDQDKERTEEPTQKKLDEAIKRGDVAKSQEVVTWFMLLAAGLALVALVPATASGLTQTFRGLLANAGTVPADGAGLMRAGRAVLVDTLYWMALPLGLFAAAGLTGSLLQHRLVFTGEPLKPKLSKISPLAGFKRLFGAQGIFAFLKGIVKVAVVAAVVYVVARQEWAGLGRLALSEVGALPGATLATILRVVIGVIAAMTVIAVVDFLWQWQSWRRRQRMTREEIKEEMKQSDGDPQIKARIRQIRIERSRRRMMAKVPTATVVITNPTHFAVALHYEPGMSAPVCVAKGVDALAFRIREVATGAGVPLVENPPLARALHATTEIDQEIDPEHYRAVAEVIGYVLGVRKRN